MKQKISLKAITAALVIFVAPQATWAVNEFFSPSSTQTRIPVDYRNMTNGAFISGATGSDCECSEHNDGTAPSTFADCTNEATEIATSSGTYYLQLETTETDSDYTLVKCTSTSTNSGDYFARVSHNYPGAGSGLTAEQTRAALGGFGANIQVVDSPTAFDLDNGPSTDDVLIADFTVVVTDTSNSNEPACHRKITDWDGIDQTVHIDAACGFTVDNTDDVIIMPNGAGDEIATVTTSAGVAECNMVQLDDDASAAANAEAVFDNTGYTMSNSTMGTVTSVTNTVDSNMVQLSDDPTAAANAEAVFDNTGYAMSNSSLGTVTTTTTATTATTCTNVTNDVGVNEWNGVALSTTNPLPNAAADAAGGLVVSDAGGLDIDTMNLNVSNINTKMNRCGTAATEYFIVQTDAGNSSTQVKTNLTNTNFGNDQFGGSSIPKRAVVFISGNAQGLASTIQGFVTATDILSFTDTGTIPADGVEGCIF